MRAAGPSSVVEFDQDAEVGARPATMQQPIAPRATRFKARTSALREFRDASSRRALNQAQITGNRVYPSRLSAAADRAGYPALT
jgi:hypothetical protein